jgi:hypothetical protein
MMMIMFIVDDVKLIHIIFNGNWKLVHISSYHKQI